MANLIALKQMRQNELSGFVGNVITNSISGSGVYIYNNTYDYSTNYYTGSSISGAATSGNLSGASGVLALAIFNTGASGVLYTNNVSGAIDTKITISGASGITYTNNVSGALNTKIINSGLAIGLVSGALNTKIINTGLNIGLVSGALNTKVLNVINNTVSTTGRNILLGENIINNFPFPSLTVSGIYPAVNLYYTGAGTLYSKYSTSVRTSGEIDGSDSSMWTYVWDGFQWGPVYGVMRTGGFHLEQGLTFRGSNSNILNSGRSVSVNINNRILSGTWTTESGVFEKDVIAKQNLTVSGTILADSFGTLNSILQILDATSYNALNTPSILNLPQNANTIYTQGTFTGCNSGIVGAEYTLVGSGSGFSLINSTQIKVPNGVNLVVSGDYAKKIYCLAPNKITALI